MFHCLKVSMPLMQFVEEATTRVAPLRLLTQALMVGTVCEDADSPQTVRLKLIQSVLRMGIPSILFAEYRKKTNATNFQQKKYGAVIRR
jgi:hypothetical protein